MTAPNQSNGDYQQQKLVMMSVELAGYTKAFQTKGDEDAARFADEYYRLCDLVLAKKRGDIVKFMGDGCLATFPADASVDAVGAALELQRGLDDVAERHQLRLLFGANIHLAVVVEGSFGAGQSRRRDIIGRGVNQTFLLGRGPGIRISEPVYRQLPNEARAPWNKHKPPAIYHLTPRADGVLQGLGQDPGTNTTRW
jgi:class 3 adenylate cyclase